MAGGGAGGRAVCRRVGCFATTTRPIERASLPLCSWIGVGADGAPMLMNASTRPPGGSNRASLRDKQLGRLAVDRHDANLVSFGFQGDYSALTAANEAKTQPFTGACCAVKRELTVDGVKQRSILGIETGGSTATGRVWPSANSRRSHKKVPAWRNGIARLSLPAGGRGERVMSGSAAVKPSSPCQFSTVRTGRPF
jgi:hypothetical protein